MTSEISSPLEGAEPVAWAYQCGDVLQLLRVRNDRYFSMDNGATFVQGRPLVYSTPGAVMGEVRMLTVEEIEDVECHRLHDTVKHAIWKFCEVNGLTIPAANEGEKRGN